MNKKNVKPTAYIAVLGYGVVGSGVYDTIRENRPTILRSAGREIEIRRVLDIRDYPGDPVAPILTHNFDDILNDPMISIVVECIGGLHPAYDYVRACLLAGKSVVTSNKELVAKCGAELTNLAAERGLLFCFEASVGGGIPIVRPLSSTLMTDEISEISGIFNGTTNYILTQMNSGGVSFDAALKEAQRLGYAEANPSADVEGIDTCRKLSILVSMCTGLTVRPDDVHTEGITKLTAADFAFAGVFGYTIKLLGHAKIYDYGKSVRAVVAPHLVHHSHQLFSVNDVFNGILVQAKITDTVLFYGRGAGRYPTAGAVVGDIVMEAAHPEVAQRVWSEEAAKVGAIDGNISRKLIRLSAPADPEWILREYWRVKTAVLPSYEHEYAFICDEESWGCTTKKLQALVAAHPEIKVGSVVRVYESYNKPFEGRNG